jgi:hypothetical protein
MGYISNVEHHNPNNGEWLLFNTKWVIFQLYYGRYKWYFPAFSTNEELLVMYPMIQVY